MAASDVGDDSSFVRQGVGDTIERADELPIEDVAPVELPERARWLVLPCVAALAVVLYPAGSTPGIASDGEDTAGQGGGARAMTDAEKKTFDPNRILNDGQLTDAEKLKQLREQGMSLPGAPKTKSAAEMLRQIRKALASKPRDKNKTKSTAGDAAKGTSGRAQEQSATNGADTEGERSAGIGGSQYWRCPPAGRAGRSGKGTRRLSGVRGPFAALL